MTQYLEEFNKARQTSLKDDFRESIEGEKYPKNWYQPLNGIWVQQNRSATRQISFCRQVLSAVGVSESDWSIEEVDTTTSTNTVDT